MKPTLMILLGALLVAVACDTRTAKGDGPPTVSELPVPSGRFLSVSAGNGFACALEASARDYRWGHLVCWRVKP